MSNPVQPMFQINIISEKAIEIVLGDSIDLATHEKVMAWYRDLLSDPFPGFVSASPAYASVCVLFEPEKTGKLHPVGAVSEFLREREKKIAAGVSQEKITGGEVEVPVHYDGPDLEDVAARLGMTTAEVVALHSKSDYTVFMNGFLPGFPYLGPLPERLELPRRNTPRERVPAGSVAIAGRQTGIYPQTSPGGWHLIGRTDLRLFDPFRDPPVRLQPGMRVRFVPVF